MLLNVGYVTIVELLNPLQNALLQLALLAINAGTRVLLPMFIYHLFPESNHQEYNSSSVGVMAFILSFLDIAVPFIATLFQSDLCLRQYLHTPDPISSEENFKLCIILLENGSCVSSVQVQNVLNFIPAPIYSWQCRNAVLRNYLPLVIYAAAFQAFANPLVYFLLSYKLCNLESICWFGFEAREYVLPGYFNSKPNPNSNSDPSSNPNPSL